MKRERIDKLVGEIASIADGLGLVRLMEVCGTHTVSLFRSGVRSLLPPNVDMLSGPGCPVCVTARGYIDAACAIAARPDVVVCTYGDMVRVPGRNGSLEAQRAQGAAVQVVYSARDAVRIATERPDRTIVFLAVGFETTAPATAAALSEARDRKLDNFFALCAHKLVVPAMALLLEDGDVPIDGFLCPGHVSVIIGAEAYRPIAEDYRRPCVVAGFEPVQMLEGVLALLRQMRDGRAAVENVYPVAVSDEGNAIARRMLDEVFVPAPAVWRAMGELPASGLELSPAFAGFDARRRFDVQVDADYESPGCRCGEVIQGKVKPDACALFGDTCTPMQPIGPCMVSSEGTCAAWFKYGPQSGRGKQKAERAAKT